MCSTAPANLDTYAEWMCDPVVSVLDCWFSAASIAVVAVCPTWFPNMFYWPNGGASMAGANTPASNNVTVKMYDPVNLTPYNLSASIMNESTSEDTPGGSWWHQAVTQAFLELGNLTYVFGVLPNATFDVTGFASVVLTTITGKSGTTVKISEAYKTQDDLFNELSRSNFTPVVISTKPQTVKLHPQLSPNHDFGVMNTTILPDGTKNVTLRNPWGDEEGYHLWDVWENCYYVHHLTNWDVLKPGQGQ